MLASSELISWYIGSVILTSSRNSKLKCSPNSWRNQVNWAASGTLVNPQKSLSSFERLKKLISIDVSDINKIFWTIKALRVKVRLNSLVFCKRLKYIQYGGTNKTDMQRVENIQGYS